MDILLKKREFYVKICNTKERKQLDMKSFDYIKKNFEARQFNDEMIITLIELLIREYRLDNYVDVISFNRDKMENDGAYFPNDNRLLINPNIVMENTARWYNKKDFDRGDTSFNRMYNLFLLETIYHEVNHVIQVKEADRKVNDLLHKIIREGIELAKRIPDKLSFDEEIMYKFYYLNVLIERNAEIMSLYTLINNNNLTNTFTKTELSYLKENLIKLAKFGYHGKCNPVFTYYNLIKKNKEYKELNFCEKYDLITTLSWGLPITGKIDDKIKELKMSINV